MISVKPSCLTWLSFTSTTKLHADEMKRRLRTTGNESVQEWRIGEEGVGRATLEADPERNRMDCPQVVSDTVQLSQSRCHGLTNPLRKYSHVTEKSSKYLPRYRSIWYAPALCQLNYWKIIALKLAQKSTCRAWVFRNALYAYHKTRAELLHLLHRLNWNTLLQQMALRGKTLSIHRDNKLTHSLVFSSVLFVCFLYFTSFTHYM